MYDKMRLIPGLPRLTICGDVEQSVMYSDLVDRRKLLKGAIIPSQRKASSPGRARCEPQLTNSLA
jgi:hypothetical protein